ncbi:MAG TPA: PAS domain S-box protein, partial [Candidatus Limnocylindrales bacterium]
MSDQAIALVISDPRTLVLVATAKGWLFILVTGTVLALLLARRDRSIRQAEDAAIESEQRFRAFMANGPFEAFMKDADGRYVYGNPAFAEANRGSLGDDWLGRRDDELADDGQASIHAEDMDVMASDQPREFVRTVGSGADSRTMLVYKFPIHGADHGHRAFLGGLRIDITEQERSRDELARLAAAIEQAADTIMVTDASEQIVYANAALERASGYERSELIGQRPGILRSGVHPPEHYETMRRAIREGRPWTGDLVDRRKDGTLYELNTTISPVVDAARRLVGWVQVGRDVTHERELEAQLRQAQKMEAVGRLAGGIAHDFNNLLTAIGGYAELLLSELPRGDRAFEDAQEVLRAADRASQLTRQLLAFGRRQVLQLEVIDLNAVIAGVVPMVRRLIGEDVALVTSLAPDLLPVTADRGQLEQVIVNLAVNARDAMPSGGTLTLATSSGTAARPGDGDGLVEGRPGRDVVLAVSDTGEGIDDDVRVHMFEPFYTTKKDGRGTGLGLATVYGIVEQSGGSIEVESRLGHGTTFRIRLPAVDRRGPSKGAPEIPTKQPSPGTERILLVEDEPAVRRLAITALERWGYRVTAATSPDEALRLTASGIDGLDLVITDVVMPGMTGFEMAVRLRSTRPDLPVLYVSGHAEEAVIHPGP